MQPPASSSDADKLPPSWFARQRTVLARVIVLTAIGTVMAAGGVMWATGKFNAEAVGYPGIWLFSFIGSASVFLPLPAPAGVCAGAAPSFGLNLWLIGLISGSAEVLGELMGYLAGTTGKSIIERRSWYVKVRGWMHKRGVVVLFLASVVPNPFFDIVGIAAGSMGYPLRKFMPVVFVAKTIKSTGIAFACFHGVGLIQRLIG
jgi:membrane protein YqaA with SNARE-associated domain